MLVGELYGVSRDRAASRASRLLGTLGLLQRKDQKVQAYSKGMKQRLILAMALLHEPQLLFLDEPTSGLDVQSTQMILSMLRELNRQGTTIFLTTHNMQEANSLCDRVGIIHAGRMVAVDAPERLKSAIERVHRIEVSFNREVPDGALDALYGVVGVNRTGDKWQISANDQDTAIKSLVEFCRDHNLAILTLNTHAPSLDEVFLQLTQERGP
jgi:ABC-2 type transport system ATP-binding protein